jgi:hypothetical protein
LSYHSALGLREYEELKYGYPAAGEEWTGYLSIDFRRFAAIPVAKDGTDLFTVISISLAQGRI